TLERLRVCMRRELRTIDSRFDAAHLRLKRVHPGVRLRQQAQRLDELEQRLTAFMQRELRAVGSRLDATRLRLKLAHPGLRILQQKQRLDDLEQRLTGGMRAALHTDRTHVSETITRLVRQSPLPDVRDYLMRHGRLLRRLEHAIKQRVSSAEHRLDLAARTLHTVSPLATLSRGFAVVKRASDGVVLTDSKSVNVGDEIEATLAHGTLTARVTRQEPELELC